MKRKAYELLPSRLEPFVERSYDFLMGVTSNEPPADEFIQEFFSRQEYDRLVDGFEQQLRRTADHRGLYDLLTSNSGLGGVEVKTCKYQYAIVRKLSPSVVVEAGVCNGLSTLAILLGLAENGSGILHSVDYPLRAEESLEEFLEYRHLRPRKFYETIPAAYDGAVVPSDMDPGWIVPEEFDDKWNLILGRSQRKLPELLPQLNGLDLFVHDSEHSHPCMMFEYELAWEWLEDGGVILSDDIDANDAFDVFTRNRGSVSGRLPNQIGYVR